MFHLAANFVAIANVANTEVPALNDDVFTLRSSRLVPTEDLYLGAVFSSAVTLLRTRINSPNVRRISPAFIVPTDTTLLPKTDPNFMDMRSNPLLLKRDEALIYESTDSAAGPNNHYIISWLLRDRQPAPVGDIYTIRGTSTTAGVASTWTTITVTWDNDLPVGDYVVIGGSFISATAVAFSVMFDGQTYRPGGLAGADAGVRPPWPQYNGGFGAWGKFRSLSFPGIRVLDNATGNAHTVYLNCVKVG